MSTTTGSFICATCGAESDTWTAFCTTCGAPRAALQPSGAPAQAFWPGSLPGAQPGTDAAALAPVGGVATAARPAAAGSPAVAAAVHRGMPAEFGGLQAARVGRRIAAFSIDAAIVAAVAVAVWVFSNSLVLAGLAVAELSIGFLVWEANRGVTIGNALMGLRTTRTELPRNVGPFRSVLRGVVLLGGAIVGVVGAWVVVASSAWDPTGRGQGWHDRVGRTVTVHLPRGRRERTQEWRPADAPIAAPAPTQHLPAMPVMPTALTVAAEDSAPMPLFTALTEVRGRTSSPELREVSAEAEQRAEAVRYISPTVMSTRITVEEVDDDSYSAGEATPIPAARHNASETAGQRSFTMLFAFDTGQQARISVPGTGVIGRSPRGANELDQLVAVDDPAKSVSKSHLSFDIGDSHFRVFDHGSTNGSDVTDDEGTVIPVLPGQWVDVPQGSRIRVGQRVFAATPVATGLES